MHRIRRKESMFQYVCITLISSVLGMYSTKYALDCLLEYQIEKYSILDIYRIIFFSNETRLYEYIDLKDIFLYIPILMFFIVGTILSSMSFLKRNKSDMIYYFLRYKNMRKSIINVKGWCIEKNLLYCIVYYFSILNYLYWKQPQIYQHIEISNIICISIIGIVNKTVFLCITNYFAFYVYRIKDEGYALFYSFIIILGVILVDVPIKQICILTFDTSGYGWSSILIMLILFFLVFFKATEKISAKEVF